MASPESVSGASAAEDSGEFAEPSHFLSGLKNKPNYNHHMCELILDEPLRPTGREEGKVAVRVCGATAPILVNPENLIQFKRRQGNELEGGLDAGEVMNALRDVCPHTFIPEIGLIVVKFLLMPSVDITNAFAVACSGALEPGPIYSYQKECSLEPGTDSCWISRDLQPGQPGWIVYRLCHSESKRRIDQLAMMIPPLPAGPLSVRNFSVETSDSIHGPWSLESPNHKFITLDVSGLQEFAVVPHIECRYLRLVCSENAVGLANVPNIGFWHFCFG